MLLIVIQLCVVILVAVYHAEVGGFFVSVSLYICN